MAVHIENNLNSPESQGWVKIEQHVALVAPSRPRNSAEKVSPMTFIGFAAVSNYGRLHPTTSDYIRLQFIHSTTFDYIRLLEIFACQQLSFCCQWITRNNLLVYGLRVKSSRDPIVINNIFIAKPARLCRTPNTLSYLVSTTMS